VPLDPLDMLRAMPKSKGRRDAPSRRGPTPRKGEVTAQQRALASPSARYTPPIPQSAKTSPPWFGPLILGLLVVGVLIIITNYIGILPGETSNWYLFLGLGFITAGFLTATGWR
jgi:hypothetical protein